LLVAGLIAVVVAGLHQRLVALERVNGGPAGWATRVPLVVLIGGAIVISIGLTGLVVPSVGNELGVLVPLCLGVGFTLLAYADYAWPRCRDANVPEEQQAARRLRTFLLMGLAVMAFFWTVSLYAAQRGRERARAVAHNLASETEVVIYAKSRLALSGPGVRVDELRLAESRYQYRYSGLRMLAHGQDRYVLLPVGWVRGGASAYVLRDESDIRLEFNAR
jgi:hypothetical protein